MRRIADGIMAALWGLVGALVGPAKWLWNKVRGRPTVQASAHSVAAGNDISGVGQQIMSGGTVVGQTSTMVVQQGYFAEDHDRLVRIEGKFDELAITVRRGALESTPVPDTRALAEESTKDVEVQLDEALRLRSEGREREAIECLLEAYKRDLRPKAKAQLHLLAGNTYIRLADEKSSEWHLHEALAAAVEAADRDAQIQGT